MALDYQKIKHWPFKPMVRRYVREDLVRSAIGFGAGLPGLLRAGDERFLGAQAEPLPMAAVALADGDFWQADPQAGLHWQQIVHAEEGITMHRPLPPEGTVVIERRIDEIYDRGVEKGAMVVEDHRFRTESGEPVLDVRVITVLKGDGGFGGSADGAPKPVPVPTDRPADLTIALPTPLAADEPLFQLKGDFDVSAAIRDAKPGQQMIRGLGAFGLAGRAVLHLVCGNDPQRLRKLVVRYAGPMLTDETMHVELWRTGPGRVSFQMSSVERGARVLMSSHAEFVPA
jgi:hypothetical protein